MELALSGKGDPYHVVKVEVKAEEEEESSESNEECLSKYVSVKNCIQPNQQDSKANCKQSAIQKLQTSPSRKSKPSISKGSKKPSEKEDELRCEDKDSPDGKVYKCKVCRKVSKTPSQHAVHTKSHVRYRCCECQQLFVSMYTLTRHAAVHTAATGRWSALPHVCATCSKAFPVPSHLRLHELLHKAKQFICEFCSFESATESNLRKHLLRHSSDKSLTCDICKKTFKVIGNLRVHMERHIGERNYLCMECGKSFNTKSNLNGHMQTHAKEKKYVCLQCVPNRSFARNTDLTRHCKSLHTFPELPFNFYSDS